jgi:hypothetical protein
MKRFVLTSALLGLAFTAAAQGTVPTPAGESTQRQANAQDVTPHGTAASAKNKRTQENAVAGEQVSDRHCLRRTGSRLLRADSRDNKCANAAGRSYTSEDIDRTGATDLGEALRQLDPAVH